MSGRVTDLEVNPDNVNEFYIAYASGGLFHTINNGQSMEPVFDQEATIKYYMLDEQNTLFLQAANSEYNKIYAEEELIVF